MNGSPLEEALATCRVLVCVGPGGVGKTTVAAALALRAAATGTSSLVCTIDPARRLAQALGLESLGNVEAPIPAAHLAASGLPRDVPLKAMMLDMKRSWDELIAQYAGPELRDRILSNRFYQSLSSALAGSQEYIAMEKLWELRHRRDYRLIVLDTPPTVHALDFLEAPDRLLQFLDQDAAKWLLGPALAAGKVGLRLFSLGGGLVARTLAKFTGAETLSALAEFMLSMNELSEGFRERARQTRAMLTADSTGFVLVTSLSQERLTETVAFHRLLLEQKMRVVAVVANRVHPTPSPELKLAAAAVPGELGQKLSRTLEENAALAAEDAEGLALLESRCAPTPVVRVPWLPGDVHDLASLWRTGQHLVAAP